MKLISFLLVSLKTIQGYAYYIEFQTIIKAQP